MLASPVVVITDSNKRLIELDQSSAIFPEIVQQALLPTHQAFCQLLARHCCDSSIGLGDLRDGT